MKIINNPNHQQINYELAQEIIRRDKALKEGKTKAWDWEEVKKELRSKYR